MTGAELLELAKILGPTLCMVLAAMYGSWRIGDRFLTRLERSLDKLEAALTVVVTEQGQHELRDVQRHAAGDAHLAEYAARTTAEHRELEQRFELVLAEVRASDPFERVTKPARGGR